MFVTFALMAMQSMSPMHGLVARIGGTAFPHTAVCYLVGTSPDRRQLFTCTHSRIDGVPPSLFVWDAATGGHVARHPLCGDDGYAIDVQLAPDGVRAIIRLSGREVGCRLVSMDPATGRVTARGVVGESQPEDVGETRYSASGWLAYRYGTTTELRNDTTRHRVVIESETTPLAGTIFRTDGKMFAVVPAHKPARLFGLPAGTVALEIPAAAEQSLVGFTPDNTGFALWSKGAGGWSLDLWDVAAKTRRTVLDGQAVPGRVVFAPDGKTFARLPHEGTWGHPRGDWEVRDLATGRVLARAPGDARPWGAAFSADGKTLFTQPSWRTVAAWDAATGRPRTPGVPGGVSAFRFTAGGQLVGLACGSVFTWDPRTGKELARAPLPRHADHAYGFQFTPDGRRLGFVDFARDLTHWDFRTGAERTVRVPPPQIPGSPFERFTPDGVLQVMADPPVVKALACETGTVVGRDLPASWGDVGTRLHVSATAASPDGRFLAVGSSARGEGEAARVVVTVFDLTRRESVRTVELASGQPRKLAFSPDGRSLLVVGRGVTVLDAETLRTVGSVPLKRSVVRSAQFAPDGRTFAYSLDQHEVRVVELASWQVRAVLPSPWRNDEWNGSTGISDGVAFSPDGRLIATATPAGGLLVWDARRLGPDPAGAGLAAAWDALAADAGRALGAVREFAAARGAVPYLAAKLPPVVSPDAGGLAKLIAALDDDEFAARERATKELERLGRVAEPSLARAARVAASPESRKRLSALLDRVASGKSSPDDLRVIRAVEAVEWVGTPDAVRLLESWAGGAEGARLTTEAKAAIARLAKR